MRGRSLRLRGPLVALLAIAAAIPGSVAASRSSSATAPLPQDPVPSNNATQVGVGTAFYWDAGSGDVASYDLYLGTTTSPPLVAAVIQPPYAPPQPLQEFTRYYWRVVVRDSEGLTTTGPLWSFTTRAANTAPSTPALLNPPDGGLYMPLASSLDWWCTDIDGDALTFDVYFGVAPDLPLIASNVSGTTYNPGLLANDTQYNWYVVARDSHGAEARSSTALFSTRPVNFVPTEPSNPSPPDNATIQPLSLTLRWDSVDNDGETVLFDVYFGGTNPPPLVANNITTRSWNVSGLGYDTMYFWRIVARDPHGAEAPGPTWSFTTRLPNYPPAAPSSPFPSDGGTNVSIVNLSRTLSWTSSDPDNDVLQYDVYFGTASPPPLVATNRTQSYYAATGLSFVTRYYWRIVVRDAKGVEVSGPEWSFTTEVNDPPNAPSNPTPANNATNQGDPLVRVVLHWSGTDPESWQSLKYDFYFGTSATPPLIASNLTSASYSTSALAMGTTYYWRVVARDPFGLTANGPLWSFSTFVDLPPAVPSNPSPADGAHLTGTAALLSWTCSDPENKPLSYKVYIGVPPSFGLVATVSTPQYAFEVHAYDQLIGWYIVASDGRSSTTGPVWTYTTGSNLPPNAPANPSPADNATGVERATTLTWVGTDPEGGALRYDVYFGTTSPPPLVAGNLGTNSYALGQLSYSTDYYWRIAVRDDHDQVTTGGIWKFRTIEISPGTWFPPDNATNVQPAVTLNWRVSGEDNDATTYDIFFGTAADPPLVASDLTAAFYAPGLLEPGTVYHWRILAIDGTNARVGPILSFTTSATVADAGVIPLELTMGQCHPNPFNPQTIIPYAVPKGSPLRVRMTIFDATGHPVRVLVDETQSAGVHEVVWRGDNDAGTTVSSGIYYCVLRAGNERRTQKLVLLK